MKGGTWHAARKSLAYGRVLGYPVPTERDINNQENKIQGILLLEQGTPEEKAEQLKCRKADLERRIRIGSKEEYAAFTAQVARA